jgi:hypothetical protein
MHYRDIEVYYLPQLLIDSYISLELGGLEHVYSLVVLEVRSLKSFSPG